MTAPRGDEFDRWDAELREIGFAVDAEFAPLSEPQFSWRPGPHRWSIGECLDHLALSSGQVLGKLRPALRKARETQRLGDPPFKLGLLGSWFVRMMETPGKRPMPAPQNFVPPSDTPKTEVLVGFQASVRELRECIDSARGLALDRIRAPSAAKGAGWLRLNAAAWLAATLAHTRRHLSQARRVREAPGFPA